MSEDNIKGLKELHFNKCEDHSKITCWLSGGLKIEQELNESDEMMLRDTIRKILHSSIEINLEI